MKPLSFPRYDAILLVAFGGPEEPADVIPFLENVLRGRNVPRERLLEVAEHYHHFDGVSPINGQMRELVGLLEAELRERGPQVPVYWGNRNWQPMLADTVGKMRDDGVRRAAAFVVGLQLLLGMPPISGRHRAGAGGRGWASATARQVAAFL